MQVGVPGRDQRNPQGMRHPKAHDPHIARCRDVYQVRLERAHLRGHPILVAAEQGVARQVVIQRKCRQTSLGFQRGKRLRLDNARLRAAVNAEERKLPASGVRNELPAERTDAIRFRERIREEGDAQR